VPRLRASGQIDWRLGGHFYAPPVWTPRGYGADGVVISPNNRVDLYSVARPSTYTLLGSYFVTGNDGHTGMVFDGLGNLWMWRRGARSLDRISTATGALLQSIPIATSRSLRGLALAPQIPVKTESTTWGRVKSLYR